ncbi:MAG: hypothetical protein BGO68_03625 [Candidatus Amoebophilus sp. 36-38]|nr:MAG: hypothetical protein BGO68_03625 [Candidatus Amoebophilus sp. 36-38]
MIYRWIKTLSLVFGLLLLVSSIFIAEKKYIDQPCKRINIHIKNLSDQSFIKEKDILAYLAKKYENTLSLQQIKSKNIETIIKSHDFIRFCTVYKTWKGDLNILILPKQVIARMTCSSETDRYIDEVGGILPLSTSYAARVLLVDSEILCKLKSSIRDAPYGEAILKALNLIDKDPFWKAQVTHISIDNRNELTLSTQFNRHKVYLGSPDNIENKMKKLKIFYKDILPYKGWNSYKRINLKFDNQIVCE